ncbi:MAG: VCBS repeat-containing protein [Saprospiraceae bacterium]|nr:VCBS repeat-containing protein [Saprospiraceae bacterium]
MKHILTFLLLVPWSLYGQALFSKVVDPNNPATTFTNTQARYKGVCWIDVDEDNRPDLFVSQRFLFHNDGNGQFSQWPDVAGATGGQDAAGASWGDLNNDGHADAISASLVSGLHLSNGDQTFTAASDLLSNFTDYSAWDCALADADNNGRLDVLFVHANGFHTSGPFPCRMFLQGTDGKFTAVTGYEFTDQLAPYTVPIWADYDLDGDMDLFIGSGPAGSGAQDFCYRNLLKENGVFSLQRLSTAPFSALQDGQTYNFPDFDNDGDLDICLTNYTGAPNRFYKKGSTGYSSITTPFTTQGQHLANVWGDFDNDGYQDMLLSIDNNTSVQYYHNNGNGTFANAATAAVAFTNVCGIALADYDNDGDLDSYINGIGTSRSLFRNDDLAGNRHWVELSLQGTQSNRSAIGASIRIKATIQGKAVWQIRQVQAHNSFQSQSDLRQHFGLGDATSVDSVEVSWPSGLRETFAGLQANSFYKIIEGQGLNVITAAVEPGFPSRLLAQPNPFHDAVQLTSPWPNDPVAEVQVLDARGRSVPAMVALGESPIHVRFGSEIAAGVYFIRIQTAAQRVLYQKLIKQ